jgi:hypothetical protein
MRVASRRRIYWATLLLLSLPILIAAVRSAGVLAHASGDQAIIQMYADDIPDALPLIGAYSRLGFHHPGPMLHYLVAAPVHLLGAYGMNLTAAAIAIGSLGGLLVLMYRRGGQPLFVLGVAMAIVLERSMGLDVLSVWNPYVLILPFALAVTLAWSVLCGDRGALPWLAVVGTFVAQAHLGLAPSVAFLFLLAFGWVLTDSLRRRRVRAVPSSAASTSGWGRSPLVAGAAFLILWIPPLVDQLIHHPGNISRIVSSSGSADPRVGLTRALGLLGLLIGRVDPVRLDSTSDLRILRSVGDGSIWWLLVPIAAILLTAVLAHRRALGAQLRLAVVLAGLLAAAAVSFATITGLPYLYLERWVVVISVLIWANLIWTVLAALVTELDRILLVAEDPWSRRGSLLVLSAGAAALGILALVPLASTPGHSNDRDSSRVIGQMVAPIRSAVGGCELMVVQPVSDPLELQISSGIIAELRHDGVDAVIADEFSFAHGARHSLDGRTASCTLDVRRADSGSPVAGEVIARSDPFSDGDRSVPSFLVLMR